MSRGFSLIEATAAVAVISIVMLGTSLLLSRLPITGREARDQDVALRVARTRLELLQGGGYAALPTTTPMAFNDSLLTTLASSSASLTVADYASTTKRVDVNVSWLGSKGMRTITLTSLISQSAGLP
ncbi:MAG TPA: type II secretion system protein [Candidatus Paceibacterota bacterium]|nr:type II secretion system protein [Candidatus Paceibacterota bacterium]